MLAVGRIIGDRYEIVSKVGSGGMADVYKAQDHRLNRFVAVKVLKQEYSSDTNFVAKFRGEAQSAAGLSHPNIVNVYDVGEEDGLYYIVMELVEGITLKKFIERKGKLELKEAVGIAIQIAQGMEAAHDNHIIHRDIKPQNIIISREGKVKVADFGIARAASSNTITAGAVGSVHYISPEQARGGYSDEKSDIYSLGVTLYEMLSGTMPFAAENTVSVALLHIQEEAVPLRELNPSIPASIERVVQKCMQKKPERRYLSASDLIVDLKRAISDPEGEFVQISAKAGDSPTIHLSDNEMGKLKSARFQRDSDLEDESGTGAGARKDKDRDSYGASRSKLSVLEEDDSDEMNPKMEKIMLIGGIVAIVILAAVIIVLVVKGFHLFESKKNSTQDGNTTGTEGTMTPGSDDAEGTDKNGEMDNAGMQGSAGGQQEGDDSETKEGDNDSDTAQIAMPTLTGRTLSEAIDILEQNDLAGNYRYQYEFNDSFEKDFVYLQTPEAGTMVSSADPVTMMVSNGKRLLTIPDVYNRLQEEAETILKENGFDVKHDYAYSDALDSGRVIYTIPERNTEARKGDSVTIVVSRGPETVTTEVPNLIGHTEAEANQLLKDAGLYGRPTYTHSSEVAEGLVITQDTSIGVSVEEGSTIGFSVSLGEEEVSYSYVGSVTIDQLPLPEGEASANVVILMDQTGQEGVVLREGTFTADDFPMTIDGILGTSLDSGIVYMRINGEIYGSHVWYANFTQVED